VMWEFSIKKKKKKEGPIAFMALC